MSKSNNNQVILEIPVVEKEDFKKLIKLYRKKFIRNAEAHVIEVFKENTNLINNLRNKEASDVIENARELVWQKYLREEQIFSANLLTDLEQSLDLPKKIMDHVLKEEHNPRKIFGKYAGKVFPYIYELSLSNTNSRRCRSGSVFQYIIYRIYEVLGYKYDSQKKVGKEIFSKAGLGKIVDSVLPGVDEFEIKRSKTIIGTMKTSLRERWQEVIEELHRTGVPEIYLLTMDDKITASKAKQMDEHNVTIVTSEKIAKSDSLKGMKNIISFEEYLFEEIPNRNSYWKKNRS